MENLHKKCFTVLAIFVVYSKIYFASRVGDNSIIIHNHLLRSGILCYDFYKHTHINMTKQLNQENYHLLSGFKDHALSAHDTPLPSVSALH